MLYLNNEFLFVHLFYIIYCIFINISYFCIYFIIYYHNSWLESRLDVILIDFKIVIMKFNIIKNIINIINYHFITLKSIFKSNKNLLNDRELSNYSNIIFNDNFFNFNKNIVFNEEINYKNKNADFYENKIYYTTNDTKIVVITNNVLASFTSPKKCKKSRIVASFINVPNKDIDYSIVISLLGNEIYMKKYKWPWSQIVVILNDRQENRTYYFDKEWGYKYKYVKMSLFIKFLKESDREYINRFLNENLLFFSRIDWKTILVLFKENNIDISGGDKSLRDKLSINEYKLSIACFFLNIQNEFIAWNIIGSFNLEKLEKGKKLNEMKYLINTNNDLDLINPEKKIDEFKSTIVNVNKVTSFNQFVTFTSNFVGKKEKRRIIACRYSRLNNEISIENVIDKQKTVFINNAGNLPWFGVVIIYNEENIDEMKKNYLFYKQYNIFICSLRDFVLLINSNTQEIRNDVFNDFLFLFHNFEWDHVKNLLKINDIIITKGNNNMRHLLSINHYKLSMFLYILNVRKFEIGSNFHKK